MVAKSLGCVRGGPMRRRGGGGGKGRAAGGREGSRLDESQKESEGERKGYGNLGPDRSEGSA